MRFKIYLCENEKCLKHFTRSESNCSSRNYCSIECCHESYVDDVGSMKDFSGCSGCIGGQSGSWAYVDHISIMCGEPAWFNFNIFKAQAMVYAILMYPERFLTDEEEIRKANIIRSMIQNSVLEIRKISQLNDEEIYLEFKQRGF